MPGIMARKLRRWESAGWVGVGIVGPLLHFAYDWSGKSRIVAAFSAVNESIWEHMKILFFPLLLLALVELVVFGRHYRNFLAVKLAAIFFGLLTIPVLYYTYSGIWGQSLQAVDIAIYYIAAAVSGIVTYSLAERGRLVGVWKQAVGLLGLLTIGFLFVWFTYQTPHLAIFRDPVTGLFGR